MGGTRKDGATARKEESGRCELQSQGQRHRAKSDAKDINMEEKGNEVGGAEGGRGGLA